MRLARINPAVTLMIALPLVAVAASVGTAVVAVSRGDPPLPGQYHWEGDKLDHDFAQSKRAAELHFSAAMALQPERGVCHLSLKLDGGGLPPEVDLDLIHVTTPALDRTVRFMRIADSSSYSAPCMPLPSARWHLELHDPQLSWSFRSAATGDLKTITLSSGSPADDSAIP
jgi:hypothetical protein